MTHMSGYVARWRRRGEDGGATCLVGVEENGRFQFPLPRASSLSSSHPRRWLRRIPAAAIHSAAAAQNPRAAALAKAMLASPAKSHRWAPPRPPSPSPFSGARVWRPVAEGEATESVDRGLPHGRGAWCLPTVRSFASQVKLAYGNWVDILPEQGPNPARTLADE